MSAKEAERSHLSRELHDDVLQIVLGLRLNMEAARRAPREVLNAATLDLWIPLVQEVLDHLQNLTMTLRRPAVERHGLSRELRTYVDRIAARSNPAIHLNIAETLGPLTPATELACFRIVQESLSNAVKHAAATQIWASVWRTAGILKVAIRDDGVGFDPTATHAGEGGAGHLGLESMRERAALAGGRLTVESSVGTGTIISAELPTIGFESGAAAPEDG
jgi:signal transduction histidine kinase